MRGGAFDPAAKTPARIRRNFARGDTGATNNALVLSGTGGLNTGNTGVFVQLRDTSLLVDIAGVGVQLRTSSGLQISSGLGIKLRDSTLLIDINGIGANNLVPFTGATTNVNLGTWSLSAGRTIVSSTTESRYSIGDFTDPRTDLKGPPPSYITDVAYDLILGGTSNNSIAAWGMAFFDGGAWFNDNCTVNGGMTILAGLNSSAVNDTSGLGAIDNDGRGLYANDGSTQVLDFSNATTALWLNNLKFNTVGKGLQFKEGSNGREGQTTLIAGAKFVANTSVTANTRIFTLTRADSASAVIGSLGSGTLSAGVGFTIVSLTAAGILANDTSKVNWSLIEKS